MPSRLNKYYKPNNSSRVDKNNDLYQNLYENNSYDNISSVKNLEKTNEINLDKVRQMIQDRETYQHQREYMKLLQKEPINSPKIAREPVYEDEKKYDIKEFLSRAKLEKKDDPESEFLKNRQYDYLLNSKSYSKKKDIEEKLEEHEEKINTILNTLTNNLDLNKLSNSELSLDLLDDLKSNTTSHKELEDSAVRRIIEEKKELKKADDIDMDKSFYTSSINFAGKDFEEVLSNEIKETKEKKENVGVKILITSILLIITIITIYIIVINIRGI